MQQPPTMTPDVQTRKRKIHCKQEIIILSLQRFYSTLDNLNEIVELLKGTSDMSLRLIDWFVTNYSKAHSTSYILNGQEFVVYMNYKNQLKAYSKKMFDPFCGHQPEIEKEMNTAMREQTKQRSETSTRDSTATTTTTTTNTTATSQSQTRKRNIKNDTAAVKLLQKHDCPIVISFD